MPTLKERFKNAWNVFKVADNSGQLPSYTIGTSYAANPVRNRSYVAQSKSFINSIYVRFSLDVAGVTIKHVRLDEKGRYSEDIKDGLNDILTLEANVDQTSRSFIQDIVMMLCDEGAAAVVPVDTSTNILSSSGYEIHTMRVGKIVDWFPQHVRVDLYNDKTGQHEQITLPKNTIAVVQNPFYHIMNAPNGSLQRLIRKLQIMDQMDEDVAAGKLDLILQLPYAVQAKTRQEQAEKRLKDIEVQLTSSKRGIAYVDGTEKITQLNRPIENDIPKQIDSLKAEVLSQLGLTQGILDMTADEQTMTAYMTRTIEPIIAAIRDEFRRKFLTRTARSQKQSVEFYRDPFKLVTLQAIGEVADVLIRNEIAAANEIRPALGLPPSHDPKAEELRNPNMPQPEEGVVEEEVDDGSAATVDSVFDELEAEVDKILAES